MLTPDEMQKKIFALGRKLENNDVGMFVKELQINYQFLYNEVNEQKAQIKGMEAKLQHYRNIESSLQEAMVSAEKMSEQKLSQAEQKAREIEKEAYKKADNIIHDAQNELETIKCDIQKFKDDYLMYQDKYREFVSGQMKFIEEAKKFMIEESVDVKPLETSSFSESMGQMNDEKSVDNSEFVSSLESKSNYSTDFFENADLEEKEVSAKSEEDVRITNYANLKDVNSETYTFDVDTSKDEEIKDEEPKVELDNTINEQDIPVVNDTNNKGIEIPSMSMDISEEKDIEVPSMSMDIPEEKDIEIPSMSMDIPEVEDVLESNIKLEDNKKEDIALKATIKSIMTPIVDNMAMDNSLEDVIANRQNEEEIEEFALPNLNITEELPDFNTVNEQIEITDLNNNMIDDSIEVDFEGEFGSEIKEQEFELPQLDMDGMGFDDIQLLDEKMQEESNSVNDIMEIPNMDDIGELPNIDDISELPSIDDISEIPNIDDVGELSSVDDISELPNIDDVGELPSIDDSVQQQSPIENGMPDLSINNNIELVNINKSLYSKTRKKEDKNAEILKSMNLTPKKKEDPLLDLPPKQNMESFFSQELLASNMKMMQESMEKQQEENTNQEMMNQNHTNQRQMNQANINNGQMNQNQMNQNQMNQGQMQGGLGNQLYNGPSLQNNQMMQGGLGNQPYNGPSLQDNQMMQGGLGNQPYNGPTLQDNQVIQGGLGNQPYNGPSLQDAYLGQQYNGPSLQNRF